MVLPQFGGIPGLPTGPQSFAPPFTQEQLNQLSPEDLERVKQQLGRAGAPRPTAQQQLQGFIGQAGQFLGALPGQARETTEKIKQRFPQAGAYARGGLALAGALPAVGTAMEELQAGRSLGAVAALAPAGLSAVGAGLIGKGPIGTVAGLGLMGLGAILPGASASAAESTRQKLTGEPTKGKEGEFSTQMAMNKQLAELGTTQYRDNMGVYTSSLKDLSKAYSDQEYLNLQRNLPLINQMKNADLVRQQALMNTQNQGYMQQGVLATAGSLALGAQQNVAQLTNTALQTNPYAGAIMQAPQIRFG
jgi:hypothetical protein